MLSKGGGDNYVDISDLRWDEFEIPNICSRNLHIEALSVYTSGNNGFLEVEIHSDRE